MSSSSSPDSSGTTEARTPTSLAGSYTVPYHGEVSVRLWKEDFPEHPVTYAVFLELGGDPIGQIQEFKHPEYPERSLYSVQPLLDEGETITTGVFREALEFLLEGVPGFKLELNRKRNPDPTGAAEEPEDEGEGLRDHPGISKGDVAQVRAYVAAHIALASGFLDRFEDRLSPWVMVLTRHHMESALDHTERLIAAVQLQWDEEDLGTEEEG